MKVKVDFAPENKEKDPNRIGTYAIYSKKHWWSKWKVVGTGRYADINVAISYAKTLPPYYVERRRL